MTFKSPHKFHLHLAYLIEWGRLTCLHKSPSWELHAQLEQKEDICRCEVIQLSRLVWRSLQKASTPYEDHGSNSKSSSNHQYHSKKQDDFSSQKRKLTDIICYVRPWHHVWEDSTAVIVALKVLLSPLQTKVMNEIIQFLLTWLVWFNIFLLGVMEHKVPLVLLSHCLLIFYFYLKILEWSRNW